MPKTLIPLALEVGLLKYHTYGHADYRGDQDVAVVFLRNVDKVTQWRTPAMTNTALNRTTVGGSTLTGAVQGSKCTRSSDGTITFVEIDGEDGDSGALMFDTRLPPPDIPPLPLGPYMGYHRCIQQGQFKQRARICPLPSFDKLLRHSIVPQRPTAKKLKLIHAKTSFAILEDTDVDYEQGTLHLVKQGRSPFVETVIFVSRKEKKTAPPGTSISRKKKTSDTSSAGT